MLTTKTKVDIEMSCVQQLAKVSEEGLWWTFLIISTQMFHNHTRMQTSTIYL